MLKKCEICGQEFKTIQYGGSRRYCFDCVPIGLSFSERTTVKRQAAKAEAVKRLGGKCLKCGDTRPYVLAFHHIDGDEKDATPSRMLANSQIDDFFNEIKKCVLLCCNCHTEFHYLETNYGITLDKYLGV